MEAYPYMLAIYRNNYRYLSALIIRLYAFILSMIQLDELAPDL